MSTKRKYSGGCHCGKVRFDVQADLSSTMICNCSICSKRGWILAFASADDFNLISGADALTDYQFNRKNIHHRFCSTCGVQSFGEGKGPNGKTSMAINVLCLDGVDRTNLQPKMFDGKSL